MSHNYRRHQQWSWTRMLIHTKVLFLCSKHHRNRAERCYRVGGCGVRQKKKKNRHLQGVSDWDRRRKKRPRGASATGGRKASAWLITVSSQRLCWFEQRLFAKCNHDSKCEPNSVGPLLQSCSCSPLINISSLRWTEWAKRDSYKYTLDLRPVN